MRSAGVRNYTLAFIDSRPGRCQAAWGGQPGPPPNPLAQLIAGIRQSGGDVAVSFGGASGTELARTCRSSTQLAAQYRTAAAAYRVTHLDFDLEGPAIANTRIDDLRSQAIATLQSQARAAGAPVAVALTLPVDPTGLTSPALTQLRSAIAHGVDVGLVNLLAMDYGDSVAPRPAGRMGRYAIQAAESAHRELAPLFPGLSDAARWAKIAITPMIGRNDVATETLMLSDARELVAFAQHHRLGALSMWSASRDRACPAPTPRVAVPTCSGIRQAPGDFARVLRP